MKRTGKRWLGMGALIVVVGFAGLNALAFNQAKAMPRFSDGGPRTTAPERLGLLPRINVLLAGVNIPRPRSHRHPSDLAPDWWAPSVPGWQRDFDGFEHNPSAYAASGNCPVLLMHRERDLRVSLIKARRVFEPIPGTKEFVTFERRGHESYLSENAEQWRTAVERFIKRI